MQLIDGAALAMELRRALCQEIKTKGVRPFLKVLLVGDDQPSHLYVSLKRKAAEEVGIRVDVHELSADIPKETLIQYIQDWNRDATVNAILVQLPLPHREIEQEVIDAIDPNKDVDGFHPKNVDSLVHGTGTIISPLHQGILRLISQTPLHLHGAHSVIIANSEIFAKPLAYLLTKAGTYVDTVRSEEVKGSALKSADIVIIAIGHKNLLKAEMIKDGAVIIDVGTNKDPDGKVHGDVDRASFLNRNVFLTPVPGGVGPMTIAQLLWNVFTLTEQQTTPLV